MRISTEDAPWILALDGIECRLCGHTINTQHAASDPQGPGAWRGYAQDLQLASQPPVPGEPQLLLPAEICSMTFHRESRTMHAACWRIVERLWGKSVLTIAELDGFLDVSSDLAPFLPEAPYTVSPIESDANFTSTRPQPTPLQNITSIPASQNLFTSLEAEELQRPLLPDVGNQGLPLDLGRHVGQWLTTSKREKDVESQQSPTLSYWSSVTRMLQDHPQFSTLPSTKAAEDITQTLKNLHDRGLDCFPHLANYDTVHANAITILLTLLRIPVEDISRADDQNARRAKLQTSRSVNLPRSLETPAKVRLQLSTLRR